MNRLMTRGEWEFHARREHMESAEQQRVQELRGVDGCDHPSCERARA